MAQSATQGVVRKSDDNPTTHREAWSRNDSRHWKLAMKMEYDAIININT